MALRSGTERIESPVEEVDVPVVSILSFEALFEWHAGETIRCQVTMAEAISLAKELNDLHGLAVTLWHAGWLAYFARNRVEVEHCASELIELSTRQTLLWLAGGKILRGWARSASGHVAEGISWINEGIGDFRATGAIGSMPGYLLLKAEVLHLAARTAEALEAIAEAHALMETYEERWPAAELHRLRAELLAATGGDSDEVEASFRAARRDCEATEVPFT